MSNTTERPAEMQGLAVSELYAIARDVCDHCRDYCPFSPEPDLRELHHHALGVAEPDYRPCRAHRIHVRIDQAKKHRLIKQCEFITQQPEHPQFKDAPCRNITDNGEKYCPRHTAELAQADPAPTSPRQPVSAQLLQVDFIEGNWEVFIPSKYPLAKVRLYVGQNESDARNVADVVNAHLSAHFAESASLPVQQAQPPSQFEAWKSGMEEALRIFGDSITWSEASRAIPARIKERTTEGK